MLFDLAADRLSDAPSVPQDLYSYETRGLSVTSWHNSAKIAGRPVVLAPFEEARSHAVAPDKKKFVTGTNWALRAYAVPATAKNTGA